MSLLARCLGSARPSPGTARYLARTVLNHLCSEGPNMNISSAMNTLIVHGGQYWELVADEIGKCVAATQASKDTMRQRNILQLIPFVRWITIPGSPWWQWSAAHALMYREEINAESARSEDFRLWMLLVGLTSTEHALTLPDGFSSLIAKCTVGLDRKWCTSYLAQQGYILEYPDAGVEMKEIAIRGFTGVGQYLLSHPKPPWAVREYGDPTDFAMDFTIYNNQLPEQIDEVIVLAYSALTCALAEITAPSLHDFQFAAANSDILADLLSYARKRENGAPQALRDLPVPEQFRQLFQDWAKGEVNFTAIPGE
jgi:hypothetical protein